MFYVNCSNPLLLKIHFAHLYHRNGDDHIYFVDCRFVIILFFGSIHILCESFLGAGNREMKDTVLSLKGKYFLQGTADKILSFKEFTV